MNSKEFYSSGGVGPGMRITFKLFALAVLLCGSRAWAQEDAGSSRNSRFRLRQLQQQAQQRRQQNPPDVTPTPTPPAQPVTGAPQPTPKPTAQAAAITPPAPVAPPEQLPPATPPQVSYRDGLLTVAATNSSLSSVLTAIRNKAGVQVEGLENGAPERVAITMGPAPEGDVLAAILGGSSFDYVIVDRPDSPGIVQRVVLVPKGGATTTANAGNLPNNRNADADDDEDTGEEAAVPQDTPVRAPLAQLPVQQPQPTPQTAPQTEQPRTAEQMAEEIKRLQEQQQGQSQPQPGAPQKPPPQPEP